MANDVVGQLQEKCEWCNECILCRKLRGEAADEIIRLRSIITRWEGIMTRNYREYEGDVYYELWRRGDNPDRMDNDRVRDHYDNGDDAETACNREHNRMHRIRREQEGEDDVDMS